MRIALAVIAAALIGLPYLGLPAFYESFGYLLLSAIVLATSWNVLSGYSGYFSFGHGAFFGVGVYTTAALAGKLGWNFLWTLPLAALAATVLGVALGAIVFRVRSLRGELFALLTLAITFVLATIALNAVDGGPGIMVTVDMPKIAPTASGVIYLMMLAAAALTLWTAYAMYHSRFGTGLFAIHDDEDVAEVMGVPTYRFKLAAFAISCALAGLAGGIHAIFVSYVTVAETFSIALAVNVVLMSALGGTRHWLGPAVGAIAITVLLYAFTSGNAAVVGRALTGLILIVVIVAMPEGILGQILKRFRDRAPARAQVARPFGNVNNVNTSGEPLLVVRGVAKAFKGVQALASVDLEVRRGEILGLVGPNGSGKSTLINVVSGHHVADAGSILFEGEELVGRPAHRIARAGIARTYQIPRPFPQLTVLQNVALPPMFGQVVMDRARAEEEAWRWLAFTGLDAKAHRFPADLNLHERKFLELARALASRPKLLFLDEVLSGLTPAEMDDALRLIRAIRDQGATIVFVEHVMRAVMELTDRVAVLTYGKAIAEGVPAEVMRHPEVVSAYLGAAHV
ncbi:MAG TPA: branched-chain amino acid ABC transporter ATP-binding protein/permease [Burkholderiales bacterium]|nr:branched-chain amino acid ABC transporter ATP-binding protein/permease [Burkholderiales bacterium]